MNSCIYSGAVRHRRHAPTPHAFRYSMFMMYLDLAELDTVFRGNWLWSASRPAVARFRRADYLGDPDVPLDTAVRDMVHARTGKRPNGPVRLLTHLRYFGYIQNPVSFYYCFNDDGETLDAIVAEVTNTPWGERHAYVIPAAATSSVTPRRAIHSRMSKAMHVSPFMSMDQGYEWWLSPPSARLSIHMKNHANGACVFDATLALKRQAISGAALTRVLMRFPWMTASVVAGIYWQALRLRLKRIPFHTHPTRQKSDVPLVHAR